MIEHSALLSLVPVVCKDIMSKYGFKVVESGTHARGSFLKMKNSTTGLSFAWDPWDIGLDIRVIRLTDGEIPPYLDLNFDWFDLRDLIELRNSTLAWPQEFSTSEELARVIESLMLFLSQEFEAVLMGRFEILEELERRMRGRVAR